MEKFKKIANDIMNGWAFLLTAIYGAISGIIGILAAIVTGIEHNHHVYASSYGLTDMLNVFFHGTLAYCGLISILSLIALKLSQAKKERQLVAWTLALIIFIIFLKYFAELLYFPPDSGLVAFLLYILGLPFVLLLYIIPTIVLLIKDLRHTIAPPKVVFKNKYVALFFFFLAVVSLACLPIAWLWECLYSFFS